MLLRTWKDFVVSKDSFITSASERFELKDGRQLVRQEFFEKFGDKFEVMEVTDLGAVTVWTTTKVWCIRQQNGLEKLIFLRRNPPNE